MLGRILSFIALLSTLGLLTSASASPAGIGATFQKRIPITDSSDWERYPGIAYCPATDQYLVVYTDTEQIFGQHLDGLGNKLGSAFTISTTDAGLTPLVPVVSIGISSAQA
jgi:hypothetical protein